MRYAFLLLVLMLGSVQAAERVRLTNGEWPPYLGETLPHHGVASRIVAEAFALQGVEVQWEFHPWARSLKMAEQGQRDGSAVWLYNPEREQRFHISEPVVESGYYLFHLKDRAFDWANIEDLRDLRIAGTRGYDYGEAFQRAEAAGKFEVMRLNGDEQGLRQLLAGRIDLFPVDKVVGFDLLYQKFSAAERQRLSFHHKPLRSDSLHLLLSREVAGNTELMQRFNRGLAQLRDSGKISRYLLEIQQPLSLSH
ncbi:transporter substrate-binding domain-containing protein [Ectopseudomonas mendocina]|uniref:Transporter substrate-binding domain-containing protein n=1 Tax=Ectopseudomonas mendocina TaxID=300 RepID=A0ABD7S195_ECTME|nr:transporter substrate-binding domain-containing protein [Pseudomonas mendocina]TRO17139.1 transporter substrate-binding domain-containing protein [Pseudomonas mendocina]TRO21359.1 transporter substrate-binding domain-containing protein [Pseudomonas mendocina]